jgi:hypothetical protein
MLNLESVWTGRHAPAVSNAMAFSIQSPLRAIETATASERS